MSTRLALVIATALVALPCSASTAAVTPTPTPAVSVVQCGHLLDTAAGKLLGATTLIVDAGRIREIHAGAVDIKPYQDAATASGANLRYVKLPDATCLPGLIDAHTHLTFETSPTGYTDRFRWNTADYAIRSTAYARRTLLAGFTTVRNLGDGNYESIALRNAINAGIVPGPRIFTAGKAIGTTGGHADPTDGYRMDLAGDPGVKDGVINSPEDAWKAVRLHYKAGVDAIKIMPSGGVLDESASADNPQMTVEEIKAVVSRGPRLRPDCRRPCARCGGDPSRRPRRGGFDRAWHVHGRSRHAS